MYKKILLLSTLLISVTLSADVEDKFKINLGGMFVTDFTTKAKYSKDDTIADTPIDFGKDLDLDNESSILRLDGYYRFTNKHSIDFSYYGVKSDGHKVLDKEIEWDGTTIAVGGDVKSHFNMNIYKLSYGYSFYHDDDLELMLSLGLHITDVEIGLNAKGNINDVASDTYASAEGVTLPLPVFGLRGEYTLMDKTFFATFKAEYFYLEYEDYVGDILSVSIGLEYRFLNNYGVGVGYNTNVITFEDNRDNKQLKVENELSGAMVYLTYIY